MCRHERMPVEAYQFPHTLVYSICYGKTARLYYNGQLQATLLKAICTQNTRSGVAPNRLHSGTPNALHSHP